MPYASQAQQRMFNARAAAGDPKFIKLAREFNQATYGRPGFTAGGARTGAKGETKGGARKYASLPRKRKPSHQMAARIVKRS